MGRHFPVREKSGNFEQTGKVREITQNTVKTSGNFRKMLCYFLVIFKNELCIAVYYLLKMDQVFSLKNKTLKNTGKMEKILEKSGKFVSLEKWEP